MGGPCNGMVATRGVSYSLSSLNSLCQYCLPICHVPIGYCAFQKACS